MHESQFQIVKHLLGDVHLDTVSEITLYANSVESDCLTGNKSVINFRNTLSW